MKDIFSNALQGDCLTELAKLESESVDLIYLDPPFFTNRRHKSVTRNREKTFSFDDLWTDISEYAEFMECRLREIHRALAPHGTAFVHCDATANFLLRVLLDKIFGPSQFRSEIIWSYKRWSNSAKTLLPAHQTIFFYSKTDRYKFNLQYGAYSETTNVDQILQRRQRDSDGISKYATDENGQVIYGTEKRGVPLSDVWEIPFLNPKAKERTGYPTQKPILLLERIIGLASDPGDLVVDPFCGSGTTLVAAKLLGRNSLGFDTSEEAVQLSNKRIAEPVKTHSALLQKGRNSYVNADPDAMAVLQGLNVVPVHRNAGIDAFLNAPTENALIPIRVQRQGESIANAAKMLARAAESKKSFKAILVRTSERDDLLPMLDFPEYMFVVNATALGILSALDLRIRNSHSG